jgi:hypothetical protein
VTRAHTVARWIDQRELASVIVVPVHRARHHGTLGQLYFGMRKDRSHMTARVVGLGDHEADDLGTGGTVAERVAAVAQLTELGWALAKLPLPEYNRRTMPMVVTTLTAHAGDD